MRSTRSALIYSSWFMAMLSACQQDGELPKEELPGEELAETTAPLYGSQSYDNACADELIDFHRTGVRFGRIASASEAFEQCVAGAMRGSVLIDVDTAGPYKPCDPDPYHGTGINNEIDRVLRVARSVNDLQVSCGGGAAGADASANIGDYWSDSTESFSWTDGRLRYYYDQRSTAEYPKPYSDVAGTTWHEVMHQHGYRHTTDAEEATLSGCGYSSGYSRWYNSVPYIVGRCMAGVLLRSGRACGFTSCGRGGRMMVDRYDANDSSADADVECTCVEDPQDDKIGLLTFDNRLHDLALEGTGDALSGAADAWTVQAGDKVQAVGKFALSTRDDVLITGAQGLTLARYVMSGHELYSYARVADGVFVGGWRVHGTDDVVAVADLDGDGRDEFVLRSSWGIGVLSYDTSGKLRSLGEFKFGDSIGNWTLDTSDQFTASGDFTGSGRSMIAVRGSIGVGLLWFHPTAQRLSLYKRLDYGTKLGTFTFSTGDVLQAAADFDGDKHTDLLFKGSSGLVTVKLSGSDWALINRNANGYAFYNWTLASTDQVRGVADFTGDGQPDLLLSNDTGWGLFYRQNGAWYSYSRLLFAGGGLDSYAKVRAYGDFDGNKRVDLLVAERGGMKLYWVDANGVWKTLTRRPYVDNDPNKDGGWGDTGYFMLGSWPNASDNQYVYSTSARFDPHLRGVGDFDLDGRADVAVMN